MPIRKVILQPCVMPAGHMLCYSITSMVRQRGRETQIQVYEPHHCYITESWEIIKMERMYMCKGWMLKSCWDSHKRHHGYIKLQLKMADGPQIWLVWFICKLCCTVTGHGTVDGHWWVIQCVVASLGTADDQSWDNNESWVATPQFLSIIQVVWCIHIS